jgi:hypothetical protein
VYSRVATSDGASSTMRIFAVGQIIQSFTNVNGE